MRALQDVAELDHEAGRPVARGLDFASSSASLEGDAEPTLELAPSSDLPVPATAGHDAEAASVPAADVATQEADTAAAMAAASPVGQTAASPAAPAAAGGDANRQDIAAEQSPEPPGTPSAPLTARTASPRPAAASECQPAAAAAAAAPQQRSASSSQDGPEASAASAATQPTSPPAPLQPAQQQQQGPDGPPGRQSMDLREKRPSLDVRGSTAPPAKRPKSGDLKAAAAGSPAAAAAAAAVSALAVIPQDRQLGSGRSVGLRHLHIFHAFFSCRFAHNAAVPWADTGGPRMPIQSSFRSATCMPKLHSC